MTFRLLTYGCILLMQLVLGNSSEASLTDQAKVTVKVIDEEGSAIDKAKVKIGFESSSNKYNNIVGYTKPDGTYSASAFCNSHVGFTITKSGYYESEDTYDFVNRRFSRWEPWNTEIPVVLRKILNPVPMYARNANDPGIEVPVTDKNIGFDLKEFDWVKPYGKGKTADLECNLHIVRRGLTDFEYKADISFPGEFNGVQAVTDKLSKGSEFKLLRIAPDKGYKKTIALFLNRKPNGTTMTSNDIMNSYIFRVRSEVENGKLKKAIYGKILGGIKIRTKTKGTAYLQFTYYLNPDFTRNLEFDPTRNLFLNLPYNERVGIRR